MIGSKKLGVQDGTDLLYHHAKYGRDRERAPAVDEKVFCFCFSFVTLSNYENCDNANAIKRYSFQSNYDAIA